LCCGSQRTCWAWCYPNINKSALVIPSALEARIARIIHEYRRQHKLKSHGYITSQGICLAGIKAPERKRIHCMAVAAADTRDRGRPSSWSGQLDQIIAGTDDDTKRLVIVSAGNADPAYWTQYPDAQLTNSIHDPGQSWNALTVGAYTNLNTIQEPTLLT
jgi:hypothetical protein